MFSLSLKKTLSYEPAIWVWTKFAKKKKKIILKQ